MTTKIQLRKDFITLSSNVQKYFMKEELGPNSPLRFSGQRKDIAYSEHKENISRLFLEPSEYEKAIRYLADFLRV